MYRVGSGKRYLSSSPVQRFGTFQSRKCLRFDVQIGTWWCILTAWYQLMIEYIPGWDYTQISHRVAVVASEGLNCEGVEPPKSLRTPRASPLTPVLTISTRQSPEIKHRMANPHSQLMKTTTNNIDNLL